MAKAKQQTAEQAPAKTKTNEIEIDANVGDEIVLKRGDARLIVKIADGAIVPDFADALYRACKEDALSVLTTSQRAFHRQIADETLRARCGSIRDKVFESVK